jgi:hypothetical protein
MRQTEMKKVFMQQPIERIVCSLGIKEKEAYLMLQI